MRRKGSWKAVLVRKEGDSEVQSGISPHLSATVFINRRGHRHGCHFDVLNGLHADVAPSGSGRAATRKLATPTRARIPGERSPCV
jgi:pyruvate/2-oxoacid:ferredoxin oxidoreductase beta subunit